MKLSFSLLLALSLCSLAQRQPLPAEPPIGRAAVPATPPVTPPGVTPAAAARRVNPNKLVVGPNDFIQEANITVLRAAQKYEEYSGKRVLMTKAVAQSEVAFTMRGPLTNAEAAEFLQLIFLGEGLALVPLTQYPNIYRLMPSGE